VTSKVFGYASGEACRGFSLGGNEAPVEDWSIEQSSRYEDTQATTIKIKYSIQRNAQYQVNKKIKHEIYYHH